VQDGSPNHIYLLLGTNLGDRLQNLLVARNLIEITAGKIITESSIYETAAWGETDQPKFLNQVVEIDSDLHPHELLQELMNIESAMGRIRERKWGPRLIDIDILLYGEMIIQSETLTIPHPAMHQRRFTLLPLAEIAKDLVHPLLQKSIEDLLELCSDNLPVEKIRSQA
jgi:2-amino-4-hydroxy-6-hydroxymethyldihydropteridine diphosphokinase